MTIEVRENGLPAPREDVAFIKEILKGIVLDPEVEEKFNTGGWKPAVSVTSAGNKTRFNVIKIKDEGKNEVRKHSGNPAGSIVLGPPDFEGEKFSEVGAQKFAHQIRAVAGVRRQLELPHIHPIQ